MTDDAIERALAYERSLTPRAAAPALPAPSASRPPIAVDRVLDAAFLGTDGAVYLYRRVERAPSQ
jgi:hypothetical protein